MPKPLSAEQEDALFHTNPYLSGLEIAYQARESQLRAFLQENWLPYQRREMRASLQSVLREHHAFRRQLRQQGLL